MISSLSIDNYALIDKSAVDFQKGFTVITGETGAGKSIMLDALSLLMGARADTKAMGDKDKKTVVEARFENPDPEIRKVCEENAVDWDEKEMILRREINTSGKSRAFVNDTPVNLTVLGAVAQNLIDIHSQHSNSLLNKPTQQLAIIDAFGETFPILEDYRQTYRKYVSLRNRIKRIQESIQKGKENRDFIAFRLEQLDKIKPKRGELDALEKEFDLLNDADRIKSGLEEAVRVVGNGAGSALKSVNAAYSIMESLNLDLMDPSGNDKIAERLEALKIELRDISDTLESYNEKIDSDPTRYEKVQHRIETLEEAMKRFKVKDEEELVDLYESLKEEIKGIDGKDTDIGEMEGQLKEMAKELKEKAEKLSETRQRSAEEFARTVTDKIIPLGMPNVKFQVEMQHGKMNSDGKDIVTFYCSFNKNHPMQPVAEIASGGEISRVMLGIKAVMAEKMKLPTIIFDEIDTGVSGEIAHKMGVMMKEMSGKLQVMSVTHLPQVAALGDGHLKVYKEDETEKTVSHIKSLTSEERVREIAGMLSGDTINEVALQNARILLKSEVEPELPGLFK